ncbi:MAG: hypothetical protein ACRYGI_17610 [Janthinobacterium lividum]
MNRFALAFGSFATLASVSAFANAPMAPVQSSPGKSAPPMSTAAVTPGISCPGDTIVWVNARNHAYHVQGDPYFGHTKHGKFECRKAADAEHGHRTSKAR